MKKATVLQFLLMLTVGAFLLAPSAYATAGLRLFDGASCATSNCVEVLSDGTVHGVVHGSGSVTSYGITPVGVVTVSASVGVWTVNVSTGMTKPEMGAANAPEMDLNTTDKSTGAGTLTIQWSDTDFLLFPGFVASTAGGTANNKGTTTNLIQFNTYIDAGNNLYATGGGAVQATTASWPAFSSCGLAACSWDGVGSGGTVAGAHYSLMEELVLEVSGGTQISGDLHMQVVPEPASVLLLGGVLLVAAKAIRRSRHA